MSFCRAVYHRLGQFSIIPGTWAGTSGSLNLPNLPSAMLSSGAYLGLSKTENF